MMGAASDAMVVVVFFETSATTKATERQRKNEAIDVACLLQVARLMCGRALVASSCQNINGEVTRSIVLDD